MNIAGCTKVLTEAEIDLIHGAVLQILSETGLRIESKTILDRLAARGADINTNDMRATFSTAWVEQFIADSDIFDWSVVKPQVSAGADIFQGYYLDPETDKHTGWTEKRIADYAKLSHYLEHTEHTAMLGCPLPDINRKLIPLIQRQVCWRHGISPGGSIWDIQLAPYILEMCEIMAAAKGREVRDYFRGMVFYSSTLMLPESEAEQFVFFAEKGLRVSVNSMTSAGGSAPVTLAGALAVHLAEVLTGHFIERAFYGGTELALSSTIAPYDMRTLMYAYGRPERQIANIMMADMARRYQVPCHGHGGHTDAKKPCPEAAYQRALTTIPTLMACGSTYIGAGKLSMDEVASPIQMILDNEYAGALKRFARGCTIDADTLAVDVIREVGPGNLFTGHMHTAEHFRGELWEPSIWTREMFAGWQANDRRIDIEKARDIYREIMAHPDLEPGLSAATDRELGNIIKKAEADLGA